MKRGDIYYADLNGSIGHEQTGIRPVLIIQNNLGNKHSPTVIAAPLSSKIKKEYLPTHVVIEAGSGGLSSQSIVLTEQIYTLDKRRLKERVGCLDSSYMQEVDQCLLVSLGLSAQPLSLCQPL